MINFPGYRVNNQVGKGLNTVVYRGLRLKDGQPVIIKFLEKDFPLINEIGRIKHEANIINYLNMSGVSKCLGVEKYGYGLALILEDFGGETLSRYIAAGSFNFLKSLKIIKLLAKTLYAVHEKKVIHKDINPTNVIMNFNTQEVRLQDYSISTRLQWEKQDLKNPELLEGTLKYISPEQTGRMNRGIDYRTDLYSLGITIYELLTGTVPFTSNDPMELIHGHIAIIPEPPNKVNPEIPKNISDMVMKLIAKDAESRYQSAFGFLSDIEEWLNRKEHKRNSVNESFIIGKNDVITKFQISQKLYGREKELSTLVKSFDSVSEEGSLEFFWISGYSGIGKTSLVNEIHKHVAKRRGHFISGKFEQFKHDIPYSSFIEAFSELVRQILTENNMKIAKWKEELLTALDNNGQIIINIIPQLELLIGKQSEVPSLPPDESQNRFALVFTNFVRALAKKDSPLVLFLDDLQWADFGSLNILELFANDPSFKHLLIIGAYRDNEVNATHPLTNTIKILREKKSRFKELNINPLNTEHLNNLVADTLKTNNEKSRSLSDLIYQKTQGNPFFVIQFLYTIYENEIFHFDLNERSWRWDLDQILNLGITENVVDLMVKKIRRLSVDEQSVLKHAACLGNKFDLAILSATIGKCSGELSKIIWEILRIGMLVPLTDSFRDQYAYEEKFEHISDKDYSINYKFLHDRIQQAAYSLLFEQEKKLTHLKIGRLLFKILEVSGEKQVQIPGQELRQVKETIFEVVNHYNFANELLTDQREKKSVAKLNLLAGKKAKESAEYKTAADLFKIGIKLLNKDSWNNDYHLNFDLHCELAECAYLCGDPTITENMLKILFSRAKTDIDKARVYKISMMFYTTSNRNHEAVDMGIRALRVFKINIPHRPNIFHIIKELAKILIGFRRKNINSLLNLPELKKRELLICMDILYVLAPPSYFVNQNVFIMMILRMVHTSIINGNSVLSPVGYSFFGLLLGSGLGFYQLGYKFTKMSLTLSKRMEDVHSIGLCHFMMGCFNNNWLYHTRKNIQYLASGFKYLSTSGDINYAGYCNASMNFSMSLSGYQLDELFDANQSYVEWAKKVKSSDNADFQVITQKSIINLKGKSYSSNTFSHKGFDESKFFNELRGYSDKCPLNWYYIKKAQCLYLYRHFADALKMLSKSGEIITSVSMGQTYITEHYFYYSLVLLELAWKSSSIKQREYRRSIKRNQKKLKTWAQNCEDNFLHKYLLVEAQLAFVESKKYKAMELFEQSIILARKYDYIQDAGIANELFAQYCLKLNKHTMAKAYFNEARYCYNKWGAVGKVRHLEDKFPQFFMNAVATTISDTTVMTSQKTSIASNITSINSDETSVVSDIPNITSINSDRPDVPGVSKKTAMIFSSASSTSYSETLDVLSVVKASRAISSEIQLPKLLETLMTIVIQSAGAQKGLLILKKQDQLVIEAEGRVDSKDVKVLQSIPVETGKMLPSSMIEYVLRTKEEIVLVNASSQGRFTNEPYIKETQAKSILCMPILNNGRLICILYLENSTVVGSFTPARMELLKTLSAQVAISIENASLYNNLEQQVQERTKKLQNRAVELEEAHNNLRNTQEQLVQSAKLASLGVMNAGLAHELNNPLHFIRGFNERIKTKFKKNDKVSLDQVQYYIDEIDDNCERMKNIIEHFQKFSRKDKKQLKPIRINKVVKKSIILFKEKLRHRNIKIKMNLCEEELKIKGDTNRLEQVFINFISNSFDAISVVSDDREGLIQLDSAIENKFVVLKFSDNGTGIKETDLKHIFDPFYTTKEVGQGTGLGLSISYGIIKEHQGQVGCVSTIGKGTTFKIKLPVFIESNKIPATYAGNVNKTDVKKDFSI